MIHTLNVNGLVGKLQEIQDLLNNDQPHLVCLTETKLSPDIEDNLISVPGYSIVRHDRNIHGGGVAIYFKTDLKVTTRAPHVAHFEQELVMLKLEVCSTKLLIGCLYRPPSAPTSFWETLDQSLEDVLRVEHAQPTLLLTGDFNVDVLDVKHAQYNHLHSFLAAHNLTNHISSPTRYSSTRNSCLDLLLCQDATLIHSCTSQPTTVPTDHELVCTTLTIPPTPSQTPDPIQFDTRCLTKIDIKAFCDDLQETNLETFPPGAEQDVEVMWASWTEKFFSVLNKHAPLTTRTRRTRTQTHRFCPWSTPQLRQLQHRRLAAHRQLKRNPGDLHLREHFSHLRKEASRLSRRLKNDFFRRRCAEHSKNPRKLWQHINNVTGRTVRHHLPQGELAELNDHFAAIVEDPNRPDDLSEVRRKTNGPDTNDGTPYLDAFSPVATGTIERYLRSIDASKATGSDGVPGFLLKHCATVLAPSLTRIFNTSIATGIVPRPFKKATITPVHKSGDKSHAGNYRPISLLPIVSKILEKVISSQLKEYLTEHSLLPKEQFAYRPNHSAEDAVTLVVNNVLLARDANLSTGLVFVDLSKAFDRVEHQQLISTLAAAGVRRAALDWFASYLSDRCQQVKIGASLGEEKICSRGVPQGSVLGPLLFTLYTRLLPAKLPVKCVMFADDILLFFSSPSPQNCAQVLSSAVSDLQVSVDDLGLQINIRKTQAMFVLPRALSLPADVHVYCHGRLLETVSSYKYLGVVLDSELSWNHHVNHVLRKVSRKIFALRTAGSQLTLKSRRQYYVSVIQPDLEYGSTAFSSSLSAREKARLIQASRKGICAIARASPWTPTAPLLKIFGLAPLTLRFDLKLLLLTHRCVHSVASSLLCCQYELRTPSNSTSRRTRAQTFNTLCLPSVTRRSGEVTPLYTSTLLYNNLPSELRSPSISFPLFRCTTTKYLGHPVSRP